MQRRLSRDETFMRMVFTLAHRSTCLRRRVGCILTDVNGHVLATGYNGVAAGAPHCIDEPCPGANEPSGQGLDKCQAIHAEQNALLQCKNTLAIHTAYCTDSPCIHCVKLLMNTSCQRIVFAREYPHSDSEELWWKHFHGNRRRDTIPGLKTKFLDNHWILFPRDKLGGLML